MEGEREILIEADGTVQFVYADDLAALFDGDELRTRRASHVEPLGQGWVADMRPVGGPVLWDTVTPNPLGRVAFRTRQAALDAEVAWLRAEMARRTLEAR